MIKHLFTPYYSPCLPSHMSFSQLGTFCTFPFSLYPGTHCGIWQRFCWEHFPKVREKHSLEVFCLTQIFWSAALQALCSGWVWRKGKQEGKKKKNQTQAFVLNSFLRPFLSWFRCYHCEDYFTHPCERRVWVSAVADKGGAEWWAHPTHWPHSLSLSSVSACSFWVAGTYGRRDSCLPIIIALQRKHSATCASASLPTFVPRVSFSFVEQLYQLLQLHFGKTEPVHLEHFGKLKPMPCAWKLLGKDYLGWSASRIAPVITLSGDQVAFLQPFSSQGFCQLSVVFYFSILSSLNAFTLRKNLKGIPSLELVSSQLPAARISRNNSLLHLAAHPHGYLQPLGGLLLWASRQPGLFWLPWYSQ